MAISSLATRVFFLNISYANQFREIVLANAIGTPADLVGNGTQIALEVTTFGITLGVDEERFSR